MGENPSYRPDIDGLRAVSIILVVLYHFFSPLAPGGFIGVDVFFVISGYLISGIIFRELDQNRFSIRRFYERRCRRILPALFVVLVFVWLTGFFVLWANEFEILGKHIIAGAFFSSNIVFWREAGYFDAVSEVKPLLHLWSLGVEEQFYLLWPVTLLFLYKKQLRHLLIWILFLFYSSFLLNVFLIHSNRAATFYLLPTRFWQILAGGLLVYFERNPIKAIRKIPVSQIAAANILGISGLLLIIAGASIFQKTTPFPGWAAAIPVLGACCSISAGSASWLNRRFLGSKGFVAIGLISYPLYLWHWPLLSFARIIHGGEVSVAVRIVLVCAAVFLATGTYRFVELHFRHSVRTLSSERGLPGPRKILTRSAIVLFLLGALGFWTYRWNGLGWRFPQQKELTGDMDKKRIFDTLSRIPHCKDPDLLAGMNHCYQTEENPNAVILGDSHAPGLFVGISSAKSSHYRWMLMSQDGCPPLQGVVRADDPKFTSECKESQQLILNKILSDMHLSTVLLVSRGSLYFTGMEPSASYSKGVRLAPANSSNEDKQLSQEELFHQGYSLTIRSLLKGGKRVVLVMENPELPFYPDSCISRPLTRSWVKTVECMLPANDFMQRNRVYRSIVKQLVEENPGLEIYDSSSLFCNSQECTWKNSEGSLYFDDDHLGMQGSKLVGDSLVSWLAKEHG